jgi:selenocysteine lyase/cysteine desulfurase
MLSCAGDLQVTAAHSLLQHHTLTNPHSRNPSSLAAEREMVRARQQVLDFFNAAEDEYTVIWTR